MDFKVSISCLRCACSFELRPINDMYVSEDIACPNCNQKVPNDIAYHLRNGIRELSMVPIEWTAEDESAFDSGFSFSLKEHKFSY